MSEHAPAQAAPQPATPAQMSNGVMLQRKCACGSYGGGGECDQCRKKGNGLQRKPDTSDLPPAIPSDVDNVLQSTGHALDQSIRNWMEPRFRHDFSNVRVHTDRTAAESARRVNALAYTVGQDVVFGSGQYSPNTEKGRHLIAHELTHVVQQSRGSVDRAQPSKPVSEPSDAAEIEADRAAKSVVSGESVHVTESPSATVHAALTPEETAGIVIGSVVGAAGIAAGIAYLAGAFDKENFSDEELLEYLTAVARDRKIQKGSTSDNKARNLVSKWKVDNKFNVDEGFKTKEGSLTAVQLKRLLILEMLDGPTGESDQISIVAIFKKSTSEEIEEILTPTLGLSLQDIESDLNKEKLQELMAVLNEKLPTTGEPHVERSETPGKKSGACTVGRAIKIDFAQRQAEAIVARTIQLLDAFISNPAQSQSVQEQLNCYFNGPTESEVKRIRGDFQDVSTTLPQLAYVCPAEPFEKFRTSTGEIFEQEGDLEARSLVQEETPKTGGTPAPSASPESPNLKVIIFPPFFDSPPRHQARVFIHEAFHHAKKQAKVEEETKHYNPSCGSLSKDEALINADSFAMFAMKLTPEGAITDLAKPKQKGAQRKATNSAPSSLPAIVDQVIEADGEPLASHTQAVMESRFDHDFSDVRIHTGASAQESARSMNASAYTVGDDIVFASQQYDPHTVRSNHLLAHELTHVVQQSRGGESATQAAKAISDPSDAAEVEADRAADGVVSGRTVDVRQSPDALVHPLNEGESWALAGGILGGLGLAGLIFAATQGSFDTSKYRDCPQPWQDAGNAALKLGSIWVTNALSKIDSVLANGEKSEPFVLDQLWNHFKINPNDTDDLNKLREGFNQIQSGFAASEFECETECGEDSDSEALGYINGLFGIGLYKRVGRIHLCPAWFKKDPDTQAETIVHEIAHRFAGKGGDVYRKGKETSHQYLRLTTAEALENADSYAQFARLTFHIGSLKQETSSEQKEGATEGKTLNRKAIETNEVSDVPSSVHRALESSSQSLDTDTRDWLEPRFEHDFSDVRVHTNSIAAESAKDVNAVAYTVGRDVVFGANRYSPQTTTGRKLLAHELTHVVQQDGESRSGQHQLKVDGAPESENEADRIGERVAAGEFVSESLPGGGEHGGTLQRQADDEPIEEEAGEKKTVDQQKGGIPVIDPGRGLGGNPPPEDCLDVLWAREYARAFRLDTISVICLSAIAASDSKPDVKAARIKNAQAKGGLLKTCTKYQKVTHPFRVRFYYTDVDLRNPPGQKVETEDAKKNSQLGQTLGAGQSPKLLVYVERDLEWQQDFSTDTKSFEQKLQEIITKASTSGAKKGAKTGAIVGAVLGGLTAVGVGLAAGLALAAGGMGTAAAAGLGALAGLGAGFAVFGASTGIGALIGHARSTDRGTEALSESRTKAVQNWMNFARSLGEVKGGLKGPEADDLARDAVTLWTDKPDLLPLTVNDRRLLIRVMLDGPTLDDDERSIIKLLENSTDAEVLEILDTTADKKVRVTFQDLRSDLHGPEWVEFKKMLEGRFPTLGSPEIKRAREDGSCDASQTLQIMEARKRATQIVPIAAERIDRALADPAGQRDVMSLIQCYIPDATRRDLTSVKQTYDRIQQVIPSAKYVCPGEKGLDVDVSGVTKKTCDPKFGSLADTLVEPKEGGGLTAREQTFACSPFFKQSPTNQAITVIHEWFHRVDPETEIEEVEPKCGMLDKAVALRNPDTFAILASRLAEGRFPGAAAGIPSVNIGNFRNTGSPTAENRCLSCPQIPTLGIDPTTGANFMEVTGEISGHQAEASYDFKRTKEVAIWKSQGGSWQRTQYEAPGTLDDASAADEDAVPKNNRIYSIDGPGVHVPLPSTGDPSIDAGVYKGNFIETVNVKVADGPWTPSSNNFLWHSITWFERGDDGLLRRTRDNNEIEPGHVSIGSLPFGPGDYELPKPDEGVPV